MEKYDCVIDVYKHRERVAFWLKWIGEVLEYRSIHHDESKLLPPEKEIFDEFTPKLREFEFGSDEYKASLAEMGEGLEHHYQKNPHHPEHFTDGIDGMSIWDLVEMIADWMGAASIKNKSIDLDYLQKRHNISPQLRCIIQNTLWAADMEDINCRIPQEFQPMTNFTKEG
jgi:hypothetical protein